MAVERSRTFRFRLAGICALLLPFVLPRPATGGTDPNPLKLLISIEQHTITAPSPARVTLNLHNAGQGSVWLYRRARGPRVRPPMLEEENKAPETTGGATLAVKLEPALATDSPTVAPAQGTVLESAGLPRPKLVRLEPGDDYEEKTTLRLAPARVRVNGEGSPLWGRYHLSVVYQASFSNGEEIHRNLGVTAWEGEVASNTLEIELLAPPAVAQDSVAGTVIRADSQPLEDMRVSLSDQEERLMDQALTDSEGRFSFTHLPWGLYWVTVRREHALEDTAVFQHAEITPAQPAATLQLVMVPPEIYEPQKVLHKPVLVRITDSAGQPLDKVGLEITWSNGPLLDNVKGETGRDGTLALELIAGRNFVTLKRKGCPKQEYRGDVAVGDGIDGFKLVFECAKK